MEARSRKLNYGIAPSPQIAKISTARITYANFWLETVFKERNVDWAWDFVRFIDDEKNVVSYLQNAGKAPALRAGWCWSKAMIKTSPCLPSRFWPPMRWYNGNDAVAAR